MELTEQEQQQLETERADRSLFVQELLLSSLTEGLRLTDSSSDSSDNEFYPNAMGASVTAARLDRNNPGHNKIKQKDAASNVHVDKVPPAHVKYH